MCCSSTSAIAPQPGGGEQLLEVQRLAVIDDVQDRVGLPRLHAVLDRGQVGRGVEKRAVLLLHDHRRVEAFEEHADRALALAGQALRSQVVDDAGQPVVVKALAVACGRTSRPAAGRRGRSRRGRAAGTRATAAGSRDRRRAAWPFPRARPRRCRRCSAASCASCGSSSTAAILLRKSANFVAQLVNLRLRACAALAPPSWRRFVAGFGCACSVRSSALLARPAAASSCGQLSLALVILDQLIDQLVQPAQLGDRARSHTPRRSTKCL